MTFGVTNFTGQQYLHVKEINTSPELTPLKLTTIRAHIKHPRVFIKSLKVILTLIHINLQRDYPQLKVQDPRFSAVETFPRSVYTAGMR